jgi:hypothetical protein
VLWITVDITVGVLALLVLAVLALVLYRRVRGLMTTVGAASARVTEASAGLEVTPPRPTSSR